MQRAVLLLALLGRTESILTPIARSRPTSAPRPLQRYRRALQDWEHAYVGVAGVQSALLGGVADAASQQMLTHSVDTDHVAAMAILAACLSGALNAVWLRQLEAAVPGTSTEAVLKKTIFDYVFAGAIANSAYLVLVPLLTAALAGEVSGGDPLDGWTVDGFRSVMMLEACTFAPYNLFAFKVVPPFWRPLTAAGVSATGTIVLSAITLDTLGLGG